MSQKRHEDEIDAMLEASRAYRERVKQRGEKRCRRDELFEMIEALDAHRFREAMKS